MSLPDARYFVTCCVARPSRVLSIPACSRAVVGVIRQLDADNDIHLHCATVMPDHVHVLFTLGQRLTLSRSVAKLKGLTEQWLRTNGGSWQENFFEHRLRPTEQLQLFARYVFMNPYRAGLVTRREEWPNWITGNPEPAFVPLLEDGRLPPKEWIAESPETVGLNEDVVGLD
jgi:putative transposase